MNIPQTGQHNLALGYLYCLFTLPWALFFQISAWLNSLLPLICCSTLTIPMRPTFSKSPQLIIAELRNPISLLCGLPDSSCSPHCKTIDRIVLSHWPSCLVETTWVLANNLWMKVKCRPSCPESLTAWLGPSWAFLSLRHGMAWQWRAWNHGTTSFRLLDSLFAKFTIWCLLLMAKIRVYRTEIFVFY